MRLAGGEAAVIPFNRKMLPGFQKTTHNRRIEVIEVKRKLNRPAIGQVMVGARLMEAEYPSICGVRMVILCESSDPVLEMVCRELKIKGWKLK